MVRAGIVTTDGKFSVGLFALTLWTARFRFWPVCGGSGSESLLLEDVAPEDDVSEVSDL